MQFQKILSYDVYGHDPGGRFNYVSSLLQQTIDPVSQEAIKINAHYKAVYISPRARALTCLDRKTTASVTIIPALNEIPFDLRLVCPAADFDTLGSTAVRQAFLHLFVSNKLGLDHEQLKAELDYLLELSQSNPDALAISHTFRLRLLETYLKTERQLFNKPILINQHLDPTVHWADFGSFINLQN